VHLRLSALVLVCGARGSRRCWPPTAAIGEPMPRPTDRNRQPIAKASATGWPRWGWRIGPVGRKGGPSWTLGPREPAFIVLAHCLPRLGGVRAPRNPRGTPDDAGNQRASTQQSPVTLDQLAKTPARAAELPVDMRTALLAQALAVVGALAAPPCSGPALTDTASMTSPPSLRCLRPQEVAKLTGHRETFVQDLCRRGRFPGAFKEGKYWIIPLEAFEAWRRATTDPALEERLSVTLRSRRDGRRGPPDTEAPRTDPNPFRGARRRTRDHRKPMGARRARYSRADSEAAPAPSPADAAAARKT
jgi:hypothetical protein